MASVSPIGRQPGTQDASQWQRQVLNWLSASIDFDVREISRSFHAIGAQKFGKPVSRLSVSVERHRQPFFPVALRCLVSQDARNHRELFVTGHVALTRLHELLH